MDLIALFSYYNTQYQQLKDAVNNKANLQTEWTKGTTRDFTPYETQRLGINMGRLMKRVPTSKDDVSEYKLENGKLIFDASYTGGYVSSEAFFVDREGATLGLYFGHDKNGITFSLRKIVAIWYDPSGNPVSYRQYGKSMHGQISHIEAVISYDGPKMIIDEKASTLIANYTNYINIAHHIEVVRTPELEITNTLTHEDGTVRQSRLFPK